MIFGGDGDGDGCEVVMGVAVINVSWDGCEGVVGVRWRWSEPVLTLQPTNLYGMTGLLSGHHDEIQCIQCCVVLGTSCNDTIATKLK